MTTDMVLEEQIKLDTLQRAWQIRRMPSTSSLFEETAEEVDIFAPPSQVSTYKLMFMSRATNIHNVFVSIHHNFLLIIIIIAPNILGYSIEPHIRLGHSTAVISHHYYLHHRQLIVLIANIIRFILSVNNYLNNYQDNGYHFIWIVCDSCIC